MTLDELVESFLVACVTNAEIAMFRDHGNLDDADSGGWFTIPNELVTRFELGLLASKGGVH